MSEVCLHVDEMQGEKTLGFRKALPANLANTWSKVATRCTVPVRNGK